MQGDTTTADPPPCRMYPSGPLLRPSQHGMPVGADISGGRGLRPTRQRGRNGKGASSKSKSASLACKEHPRLVQAASKRQKMEEGSRSTEAVTSTQNGAAAVPLDDSR